MKFDISIGQKIDLAGVRAVFTLSTNDCVILISNCSQLKQCLVKLGQSGQVVGANVHVMKLEVHSALFRLGFDPFQKSTGIRADLFGCAGSFPAQISTNL